MLKKLIGLTILIFVFAIMAKAQSDNPALRPFVGSNPPQIQTSPNQQNTKNNKVGIEQPLFLVKTIFSQKARADINQERKEHKGKTALDRSLVRYTGYLAFATAALAVITVIVAGIALWQGIQMRHSIVSQQKAERAYVFIKVVIKNSDTQQENVIKIGNNQVEVIATNYGKTAAIVTSIQRFCNKFSDKSVVDELMNNVKRIASRYSIPIPPGTVIIGSGESKPIHKETFPIDDEELHGINYLEEMFLVCLGIITYKTIFGKQHKTEFCWGYEPNLFFSPDEYRQHNDYT
jgi:hypothetical protein